MLLEIIVLKTSYFFTCAILCLLGLIIATLLQMSQMEKKAKESKLIFTSKTYVQDEWKALTCSVCAIVVYLIVIPILLRHFSWLNVDAIELSSIPVGYMGTDVLLKILGVWSKWLNAAAGFKADIADEKNETTGTLTPAKPVKDSSPKI